MGKLTKTPRLKNPKDIYYSGGCPWATDLDGNQYNKIDRKTGKTVGTLEHGLTEVTAEELNILINLDLNDLM